MNKLIYSKYINQRYIMYKSRRKITIFDNNRYITFPSGSILHVIKEKPSYTTKNGATLRILESPVAEPKTKPKTEPTTEPGIKPKTPKRDPFRPPEPKVKPTPKAKKKVVDEAYEDEAHPDVRKHWDTINKKDNKNLLSKHPIYAMHGKNLAKSGYEEYGDINVNEFMKVVKDIMQIESRHGDELEELAKDVISEIWGIDRDSLNAQLTQDVSIDEDEDEMPDDDDDEDDDEINDEIRKIINKRITLNTLTHGSAVHIMKSAHHLVNEKLGAISPKLLEYYTYIAKSAHKMYWMIYFNRMMAQSGMKAGNSAVKWEDGEPQVVGKAWIFPVLIQELSKGVAELISLHDFSSHDENTQRSMKKHADGLQHEQWMIQIGPTLWKKFLKIIPKGIKLSEILTDFSVMDPDKVHEIIDASIDNPEMAQEILNSELGEHA